MSEVVNGYEKLSAIGPCISIFGSARTPTDHPNYKLTVAIAKAIAASGYGIISGGGPGIMEAANKGAQEAHEAMLPTDLSRSSVISEVDQARLYELIWKRTIASQMTPSKLARTPLKITTSAHS